MTAGWGYVASFVLGGLVALAEIVSRYRDKPFSAIRAPGAFFYVALNGAASLSALWLSRTFGITFGASGNALLVTQVLVASFGAVAFFRTSLFVTRIGDADVGIGPSSILATLLSAADRSVDRRRATVRSQEVAELMARVSFDKAHIALPTLCLALLQNVSPEEQENLAGAVNALKAVNMSDRQRSLALGLRLMNLAGPDVLKAAIAALGDEVAATAPAPIGSQLVAGAPVPG
ncbi:hypothetical protein V6U81_21165 [Micromonospora sp. CPCC 205711]|uniref:hypothetical protein n=1 Tax=Micromonospora sp. CPCC 205547 TaxID=3122400 RepID=UPI002FEF22A0